MPGPRGDPDRGNPSRGTVRPPGHRGLSRHGHRRRRCRGHLMTAMLEVKDLKVAYGKILAVKKISFSVEEGQVVTLIGTNGAGKTTTLRTISGLIRPASGEILFQGKRIDTVPAHQIVSMGLAHSPEGRKIFPQDDGRGEPPSWGLRAQGWRSQERPGRGIRPVPDPRGATQPTGRDLLGR